MTDAPLVAVDGGNSKTDVVLVGADGSVLATARGGGSNPHSLTLPGTLALIDSLIDDAWQRADVGGRERRPVLSLGAFFLAGADQPDEVDDLHDAIVARRWANDVLIGNDTLALLWAGSSAGIGVAVVVGAGVNGIGVSRSGLEAHFGALGAVTGDWGGGSGIGLAALGAAVRGEESRGPRTALSERIADHLGRPSASEVAVALHRGEIPWERLEELPALVFDTAERGDPGALTIVDRQADEVLGFAVAALQRTHQADDEVEVVLGGSVLAAAPRRLLDRVTDGVVAVAPRARVVVWRGRPVVGAAAAALHRRGAGDAAIGRLRAELSADVLAPVSDAGQAPR